MTQILFGDRIGKQGSIRVGCAAIIFDTIHENVLLTRRADNGQWCLPSGCAEPGESAAETCERETLEETGLQVQVKRLVTVYSSPDRLVIYTDGGKFQFIIIAFEAEVIGGEATLSNETTEMGYFSLSQMDTIDIFPHHRQFIVDALAGQDAAFIR
jgi:ADP-ribose pyrophosphatase YjhB (NUDIX family)